MPQLKSRKSRLRIFRIFMSVIILQIWQIDHCSASSTPILPIQQHHTVSYSENLGQIITVKNDVLSLQINTHGGDIEQAFLLTYADKLGSNNPVHLLETSKNFIYQAQSGITGKHGPDNLANGERPLYITNKSTYILADNQDELRVPLKFTTKDGVVYTKTFILKRGDFAVNIDYTINNTSNQPIEVMMFGQLKQTMELPKERDATKHYFAIKKYRGAAYSTEYQKYTKYSFKQIKSENLLVRTNGGWIAMLQKYFATAWIPLTKKQNTFYSLDLNNGQAVVGFQSSNVTVVPRHYSNLKATLWIGPELQDKMAVVAPYLDLVVDYGLLWFIAQPLFKLLTFIQSYIGNWGFSIIIITFLIRCMMYPLTKAQYTAMVKMQRLQPKIVAMRERFCNDKQRQYQEIFALYQAEKVNPIGGFLPIILQMPIFLALYYMLYASIELRHTPFIGWIKDLSAHDQYYILPILMGITMFIIQIISPSTINDSMYNKMVSLIMPIIFTIFFLWLPSGLVLYYIVSNIITIIQQQFIDRDGEPS